MVRNGLSDIAADTSLSTPAERFRTSSKDFLTQTALIDMNRPEKAIH